jgi:hypothetical protein
MENKSTFQFTFMFDGGLTGTINYTDTLSKCVGKYESDVKSGKLPCVEKLVSIENLATKI